MPPSQLLRWKKYRRQGFSILQALTSIFYLLYQHFEMAFCHYRKAVVPHHVRVGGFVEGELESAKYMREDKIELCICKA